MRKFYILNRELHEIITDKDAEIAAALPYVASDWETFMVFYGSYTPDDTDYDALIDQVRRLWQASHE